MPWFKHVPQLTCLTRTETGPGPPSSTSLPLAALLRLEVRAAGALFLPTVEVLEAVAVEVLEAVAVEEEVARIPALLLLVSPEPISSTVTYSPELRLLPTSLGRVARPLRTTGAARTSARVKLELREVGRLVPGLDPASPGLDPVSRPGLDPRMLEEEVFGLEVRPPSRGFATLGLASRFTAGTLVRPPGLASRRLVLGSLLGPSFPAAPPSFLVMLTSLLMVAPCRALLRLPWRTTALLAVAEGTGSRRGASPGATGSLWAVAGLASLRPTLSPDSLRVREEGRVELPLRNTGASLAVPAGLAL